jgi:UPF0176 protein
MSTSRPAWLVAALYRFARIGDPESLRARLLAEAREGGLVGSLIVATEGINGTIAGQPEPLRAFVERLSVVEGLGDLELKWSEAEQKPFHRMKVRLKREIVTMGVNSVDPLGAVGTYVRPADWNALISDPDTVVIDTRNAYEVDLGTFQGALDPQTASFREFPAWLEARRGQWAGRKVAMYCTGGIRCEKATAYALALGFKQVFHLKGGILAYLEQVPLEQSRWNGECFVFDERVALVHGLGRGEAELCRACRRPLTADDRANPLFEEGISCPHCHGERSEADRERYAERRRQVLLAEQRGAAPHVGSST